MSGFNFGGFDLAAGLGSLSDIGDKLQKFKQDVENSIDASIRADRSGAADVPGGSGQAGRPSPRGEDGGRGNDNAFGLGDVLRTFVSIESGDGPKSGDKNDGEEPGFVKDVVSEEISQQEKHEEGEKREGKRQNDDGRDGEATSDRDEELDNTYTVDHEQTGYDDDTTEMETNEKTTSIVSEAVATVADGLEQAAAMRQPSMDGTAMTSNPSDEVQELKALVSNLRESLAAREVQLERQSVKSAEYMVVAQKLEELQALHNETVERHAAEIRGLSTRLEDAQQKLAKSDEMHKSNKTMASLEAVIRSKDDEIRQILEEGEVLSKKQLAQETTIKQLRAKVKQLNESMERLAHQVEQNEARAEAAEKEVVVLKERHEEALEAEKKNYQRSLSEAHALLAAAERREVEAARAGTVRKLQDAELQVESLQQTVEQLQEELARVRVNSDEREENLSNEVSELQRRCAQAEARQQEILAVAVPEATAPLLRQLEAMQATMEQQTATMAEAEATWRSQMAALEENLASERKSYQEANKLTQSLRAEHDALAAQLQEATIAMRSVQEGASRDRLARREAESSLERMEGEYKAVRESLDALESVYAQQMEALQVQWQARDKESLDKIETLRNELSLANERYDELFKQQSMSVGSKEVDPNTVTEEHASGISMSFTSHPSVLPTSHTPTAGLQQKVREVERARDRLAEEVIRLEQETARGKEAQAQVEQLRLKLQEMEARYLSALELLGEREERIEELTTDIEELREGYKMQLETLADQLVALQQGQLQGGIKN